jgi:hypothetical protein
MHARSGQAEEGKRDRIARVIELTRIIRPALNFPAVLELSGCSGTFTSRA